MSRRWCGKLGTSSTQADRPSSGLDLAGQYAALLEEFHAALLQHPGYCMGVLGYNKDPAIGSVDCLLPYIGSSRHIPLLRTQDRQATKNFDQTPESANGCHFERAPRDTDSGNATAPASNGHLWGEAGSSSNHHDGMAQLNTDFDTNSVEDELTAMSNVLLGQQFLEMDRVITYDGTNFAIDLDGWPRLG